MFTPWFSTLLSTEIVDDILNILMGMIIGDDILKIPNIEKSKDISLAFTRNQVILSICHC
ncbi:MAG: hypothetical protein CMF55_01425 [Legionellales bacterium]|nr:hypothetical protein [Legionellales bacterium]HAG61512.1 hypothetical protein [Coxiellaceae bacterium]|tara:strand:- start:307 stop:486 length:180 start_codon:yes stop_codon:yes gene_type:complete